MNITSLLYSPVVKLRKLVNNFFKPIKNIFWFPFRKKMDFEIKLIREVKKNTMLYDWGSEGYRNQSLKEQVWQEIGALLETDADLCKRKWRTLRDTYKKTKYRDSLEMKSIGYKRPWKYSKYLSFLSECTSRYKRDHRIYNKSERFETDNTVTEEFEIRNDAADSAEEMEVQNDAAESGEEIELQNETTENEGVFKFDPDAESFSENKNYSFVDEDPIVSHDSPKKKQKANLEKCLIATMNSVQDYLNRPRETESINRHTHTNDDSEDELFCRSMMRKLQKFPLKKKNEAKISIMRYLSIKESDLDKKKYIKQ